MLYLPPAFRVAASLVAKVSGRAAMRLEAQLMFILMAAFVLFLLFAAAFWVCPVYPNTKLRILRSGVVVREYDKGLHIKFYPFEKSEYSVDGGKTWFAYNFRSLRRNEAFLRASGRLASIGQPERNEYGEIEYKFITPLITSDNRIHRVNIAITYQFSGPNRVYLRERLPFENACENACLPVLRSKASALSSSEIFLAQFDLQSSVRTALMGVTAYPRFSIISASLTINPDN